MSVIGKMQVNLNETFAEGQKVALSVICVDSLMANYHPENEDVVFTRYSPSGEGTFHFDQPVELPKRPAYFEREGERVDYEEPCHLYLIYVKQAERPNIEGAAFFAKIRVNCRMEYGGDSRMIELVNDYHPHAKRFEPNEARLVNLKLGIDNPRASDQMRPGEGNWWVLGYRADHLTMDEALALAHRWS